MSKLRMTIELLSDTLSGSGEGFGALIDTDVEYDSYGIPFLPAKRIKGSLRNSLSDLLDMPYFNNVLKRGLSGDAKDIIIQSIFGEKGSMQSAPIEISNFVIERYELTKTWFEYLKYQYPDFFSNESILSTFTNIRRQTSINSEGIAVPHSLRTSRVVNKKLIFESEIYIENDDPKTLYYFSLACANLKRIGTKRNRGLGEVYCLLYDENKDELISNAISSLTEEEKNENN